MRRFLLCLVVACGPAAPPAAVASKTASVAVVQTTKPGAPDHAALARDAAARGVLDVAAAELGRVYEKEKSASAKRAWGLALADAWAFEKAREVLGDDPSIPAVATEEPDGERVERALAALAARDPKTAGAALSPLGPGSSPLVLELEGRAKWALGDHVEARKAWARARSRIDASGGKIGLVATAAGAVEHLDARGAELVVARTRDKDLVGGYQSDATTSVWVETYAPGDPDPLVRFPTGILTGFALAADGKTMAVADRPIGDMMAPVPVTAHLLDARTGRIESSWDASNVDALRFLPGGRLLAARDRDVVVWDAHGKTTRTLPVVGKTPTTMRIYRVGRGTMHDNVAIKVDSRPISTAVSDDGTIAVGSSDGTIWVWPKTATSPFALRLPGAPQSEEDALAREAVALRFDPSMRSLEAVTGDGAVARWDLASRTARVVAEPKCTTDELARTAGASAPTPDALARCARAQSAAISEDGSRAVIATSLGGPRVRDARTGMPLASLDTLATDAYAFDDRAGQNVWLGGVGGEVERWDTTSGERTATLRQGGVRGFVQSVSPDGRYVAIADMTSGFRTQRQAAVRVWDTSLHRPLAGLPDDLATTHFIDHGVAIVSTREHGTFLWDVATGKHVADLDAKDERVIRASFDRARVVTLDRAHYAVLRDFHRVLRTVDLGAVPWSLAVDDAMGRVAARLETGDVVVFDLDSGRELFRATTQRGGGVTLSPDGKLLAYPDDKGFVVEALDEKREIARVHGSDLAPDMDYEPARTCIFLNDSDTLVVGPGAPGYERVYRWKIGSKPQPTELQVLSGDRYDVWPNGVAVIYDRNDTAQMVRISDGALLASVYATEGAGFLAVSRRGAVDAAGDGRSAAVTFVEGDVRTGGSSWLAWDRFAVPGLIEAAARGEIVEPPMPGELALSHSLQRDAR